ncbi:MAG TPA: S-methyl-5-thioribose-1-phosphate isomerase [Longimicrobiales bacterium]|nr:S-methyl-5-thioribose-1-phosphate isomerase [Longimicrobiales bacterium]
MKSHTDPPVAVRWADDGAGVDIIDQTLLPETETRIILRDVDQVVEAIRSLRVRGAPAIGVAAAMGLAVEMGRHVAESTAVFAERLCATAAKLRAARPTAVNLAWAVNRTAGTVSAVPDNAAAVRVMHEEATRILFEDKEMCRMIGEHAEALFQDDTGVLTHCNAGALATGGIGTALAPIYTAAAEGRRIRVFASETRPLLQGSRLTAWELDRAGIDVTLIPDSVAAVLMAQGRIDLVIVGADRIAANGDVANKIGTYGLAVLARHHVVPFYVAAPTTTIDTAAATGEDIPIEFRDPDEVRRGFGRLTAPADVTVFTPAFDVTPAGLITAIITDRGILRAPYGEAIAKMEITR